MDTSIEAEVGIVCYEEVIEQTIPDRRREIEI